MLQSCYSPNVTFSHHFHVVSHFARAGKTDLSSFELADFPNPYENGDLRRIDHISRVDYLVLEGVFGFSIVRYKTMIARAMVDAIKM